MSKEDIMSDSKENLCTAGSTLIFACSGAADVGAISDLAARQLTSEGAGKMFCLAGIGGRVSGIMESTRGAAKILAIDGCSLDCTRLCLEEAGFIDFEHIKVADLGLEKGKSPVTDENVAKVVRAAKARLGS
jgi:uncharacterized metal-binding protein